MSGFRILILAAVIFFICVGYAAAEPYIGISLGWQFAQYGTKSEGDENINYPHSHIGDYPDALDPARALYKSAKLSDTDLEDTLSGGLRAGYYFKSVPNLGVELEFTYSRPNFKRQNVTLTHPGFADPVHGLNAGQDNFTEDQLFVKAHLFRLAFNGLYRYRGLKKITPYIGVGPAMDIIHVKGTGHSGIIVAPSAWVDPVGVFGPEINETTVNVGANFKAGVEYQISNNWGLGIEYHYNWSQWNVSNFRSISNLSSEYHSQSVNLVLLRHF